MVLDGPINGISFQAYVDHVLVPDLRPGDKLAVLGDVYTEMSGTMPSLRNISWERLQRDYEQATVIPGTVGDGAIVIVRRKH